MIKNGICIVPVAPLRAEPSDRSEMVSQLLFGEPFVVLEQSDNWLKVTTFYDDYSGWVSEKQIENLFVHLYDELIKQPIPRTADALSKISFNGQSMLIPMGSFLPFFEKGIIKIGFKEFQFNAKINQDCNLEETALQLLNAPYLWGGKTLLGIDCSGLTQTVFAVLNTFLPRDAYQQAEFGETIDFIEQSQQGDLAFFDNEEGKIIHVGIILNDQKIIHASGKVRIDSLDHEGIFNEEKKIYSHKLRIIKRIALSGTTI